MLRFLFLSLIFLISFPLIAQKRISGGVLGPEQANMDIRHYTVVLDVSPETQSYTGYTEVDLILADQANSMMLDLNNTFTVSAVMVGGKIHEYSHQDGMIDIRGSFSEGRQKIRVNFSGKPLVAKNPPWDGGFQWSKDSLGRTWLAMSCQGEGADIFFPCKDHPSDEPNEGAEMIITVPRGLVVAGPGLLVKASSKGKKSTYHWKTGYTINNYCILFNVAHYEVEKRVYSTVDGNKVPMEYYVLDYNRSKAAKHLDVFERSARLLEKYFGEYPFVKEKIGIAETPHLGMEHQTMNAYGNRYRYTKVGEVDFDWLLHHEFGHEWWANKVSNKDWGHMWIQEGICSFGDALFTEDYGGREAYLARMRKTARETQNKLPIVQGDTVDGENAYHPDIYGKGALFMHTLRYVLGDDVFFPALRKFALDPRYTYDNLVMTNDVVNHFNAASGKDLSPLFRLFLYTTEKLKVSVRETAPGSYLVRLANINMALPVEINTSGGKRKFMLSGNDVLVSSTTLPVVDPDGFYLKAVTYE